MNNKQKNLHAGRRHFLKQMTQATLGAPLVKGGLAAAGAATALNASAATGVKNVVFVYIPGGSPSGASATFTPDSNLNLKVCSAPLEAVKQECVFFANTAVVQGSYVSGSQGLVQRTLGAFNAPSTIDLSLAAALGQTSPFSYLHLGVVSDLESISAYNTWNLTHDTIIDPRRAFGLMADSQIGDNGIEQMRKSLQVNSAAVARLQTKLGDFAAPRLQQNLAALNQMQAELGSNYPAGCDLKQTVWPANIINPNDGRNFSQLMDLQIDNISVALRCNLTRVITLQMGTQDGNFILDNFQIPYNQAIQGGAYSTHIAYRTYFSQQLAKLILKLKNTSDLNGNPLLDSTLVVQVTSSGDEAQHLGSDAPFMIAGGGNSIDKGRVVTAPLHTQVLDTVAQAMGVYGTIPAYSTEGPISGVVI